MNKKSFIGGALAAITTAVCLVLGISTIDSQRVDALYQRTNNENYSLILSSSNKVTASGDHDMYSQTGGKVTFTYSGISSSTSGHATINENGTIVNKDIIHSITTFSATFAGSGTLKARIAYVATEAKWGEYFELLSGNEVSFGSYPYFLEMKAFGGSVTLSSATYTYSCLVNSDAEVYDASGHYDITFKANGGSADDSNELTYSTIFNQVTSGDDYISSFTGISKVYAGIYGLKFASNKGEGSLTINFDSTYVENQITSIDVSAAQYGSNSSVFRIYVNGVSTYTEITPSTGGSVSVNATLTSLEIETSGKQAYLCGLTLNYGGKHVPGTPDNPTPYEVGFSATDANKDTYTTNSIFDNDKALSAYKVLSDGSHSSLGSSDYSYVIKDSNNQTINPSNKFPAIGAYTLIISYKSFIPVEITLNVGEYVYIVDVVASMSTVSFTTADTLSANLAGNLTATLEYSNGTNSNAISYTDFTDYDIAVKLVTPKGFTYDQATPFGTAGIWTVKVYSVDDENMYFNISITVNAIPVASVSLDKTSHTMYPDDTLQLTATVGPNNATNKVVVWSSNNESVATVDENGLVTAIAIGGATISATAADGSGKYGSCVISVTAAPIIVEHDIELTADGGTNASECTINGIDGIKVGTSKNSGNMIITVPGGTTKLSFHAAAWNGEGSGNLSMSGATASITSFALTANAGINGNSPYTLSSGSSEEDYIFETVLSNISSETDLTFSYSKRFVIWGAKYYTSESPVDPVYPTSIQLTGESNTISIGQTSQLNVEYMPSDTNVKNVTFTSNHENIATVSNDGLITGVAQGSATITATAEAASGTINASFNVTVTPVLVTSVSLDTDSTTVKAGKTVTLVATIYPSNATNKNITWSSSNNAIATVSNGVVTGIAAGNATITVTTADGNKTATCTVSVQESTSGGEESFSITYTDLPSTYQTGSTIYTADSGIKFQAYNCAGGYSSKVQFKGSSGYIQTTEELELQSVTINDRESNSLTVYGSTVAGTFVTEITGSNDVYDLTGYNYFKIARTSNGAGYCSSITVVTGTPTPINPTSIIMNPTSAEVGVGGTKQLSISYVPSNANQNKDVTWTSSNTNVATVSSTGLVSVKSTATAGQKATITARLTNITSITTTCSITVIEQQKDDHTILVYMCGADLESEHGLASGDIYEMLKVSGQPDDVNIVIETGGANSWSSSYGYGISSTKLERWHVENKALVKDDSLTYASMGLTSTLQSFLEYGLKNYPAERTGIIFWNHGGGMRGVCYDEKKNDDVLKNSEIKSAVSGALSNSGLSGQKLEWVGYDACLMQVQDIAETNSAYFKYMVASQESEAGYGWDYDNWVDDLYAKKPTETILKTIVDTFIVDNGGASSSSGDQTLSYLDLSYAGAYKTAWENMATQLNSKVTSSNKSSFNSAITGNVKHYADSDYDYFCTFDAWDFIDKLATSSAFSSFRIDSSYITAVKNAHANLVKYNLAQKGAGVSKGLCMYWPNSTRYSDVSTYYTSNETNFSNWRTFCVNKGYHA